MMKLMWKFPISNYKANQNFPHPARIFWVTFVAFPLCLRIPFPTSFLSTSKSLRFSSRFFLGPNVQIFAVRHAALLPFFAAPSLPTSIPCSRLFVLAAEAPWFALDYTKLWICLEVGSVERSPT